MRFSSIFQLPAVPVQPAVATEGVAAARTDAQEPPVAVRALPELPEDLDARVRLVGEWQLGED